MKIKPTTLNAYKLLHEGSLALAEVESHGMRIDTERLDRTINKASERIEKLERKLKEDDIFKDWKKEFGLKTSLGSRVQLGKVLFENLGYETKRRTKTGRAKTDEKALEELDLPFVKDYLRMEKLKKLRGTYLHGVKREVVDGILRPSFNVHLARTHRGQSDTPNFQNIPIRDPMIGKAIRSCFIPRDGHVLVEIDYGALEFRVCACFWKDSAMVEYASDSNKDIHRDIAMECYKLALGEVTKDSRFYAKNQFVFPELYGSYYVNCAKNLWSAIESGDLKTKQGTGLYEHLKSRGIKGPHAFENHIQWVEKELLKMFPDWAERRTEWWNKYRKRGWFRLMTGFVMAGVFTRNELMNFPIQGPAFHCLLWSLIRLVKWMKKEKMRSCIIGQIHDSIVADIHRDELDDYLVKAKQVMTRDVREAWPWIITPLEVDCEIAKTNWFEKREFAI